ncbi:hypothetical protein F8M41_000244 [Gigaspora margarita]|uniref:Uncharacterized protein n=1 Tax=Gigaspora margarita TaxID=4874 RepID=A0A8H3XGH8_GIGMA|nr:hypothetical protein F8M41_000244 [Gigaspora margarita]
MADQNTYADELTDEPKDQVPVQIEEKDKELLQYVRFKVIMLNEEYKSYRINMKNRGRIVFRGFRDHNNQPSDDKKPLSGVNNDHSSDGEEQNPAWDIYFVCFVINNLELFPSEEFAIKSILNGAVFTEEDHEEKYDPGIINKTLTSKYSYRTLWSNSKQK